MVILNLWQQKDFKEYCQKLIEDKNYKPAEIRLLAEKFLKENKL